MRAICRLRSRSAARAGAVRVWVRAITTRSRAEGDTPAAAFFFQAACSARVTRAATTTVRRSAMSTPARGFGGRRPPSASCSVSGAGAGGSKGGAASPRQSPVCTHWIGCPTANWACQPLAISPVVAAWVTTVTRAHASVAVVRATHAERRDAQLQIEVLVVRKVDGSASPGIWERAREECRRARGLEVDHHVVPLGKRCLSPPDIGPRGVVAGPEAPE